MENVETVHGEMLEPEDWISWKWSESRRYPYESKRRFGKIIQSNEKLFIMCQPTDRSDRNFPDSWEMEEFEWAVAEGRILADSIWKVQNKLANHGRRYLRL